VIVLDTHIWIWWVHGDPGLSKHAQKLIDSSASSGLVVSSISCWEVAKLVQNGRLELPCHVSEWLVIALAYPGVQLTEISPTICVESTQLPGEFHRDPADQLIVATSRVMNVPLLTVDRKILKYPHVKLADV